MKYLLLALLLLTSCQAVTRLVRMPPEIRYVKVNPELVVKKIPESLKTPCPVEEFSLLTKEELVRVSNANKKALLKCSQDKIDAVKELQKDGYQ